jgi:hypothetical protein
MQFHIDIGGGYVDNEVVCPFIKIVISPVPN